MSRIRKAYRLVLRGRENEPSIRYAPSAAKARASLYVDLSDAWDISWRDFLGLLASCRRAPESDIALPSRHPLAASLSTGILECVTHAYGGTGGRAGTRDHFYADASDSEMQAALFHCLFSVYRRDKGRFGQPDSITYQLTALGRNVARGEAQTYPDF